MKLLVFIICMLACQSLVAQVNRAPDAIDTLTNIDEDVDIELIENPDSVLELLEEPELEFPQDELPAHDLYDDEEDGDDMSSLPTRMEPPGKVYVHATLTVFKHEELMLYR
jgi:hypothetical protein